MRSKFIECRITYTGCELRSAWAAEISGIQGDVTVAWLGPCSVPTEHLVDLEDAASGAEIRARLMLHFIIEVFENDLERAVLRQRLTVAALGEMLRHEHRITTVRDGDDLFVSGRKLTVSIATSSPVSTLIHLGVNVDPGGAPVPAVGLEELEVDPRPLADALLKRIVDEHNGVRHATSKVRPVQ